MTSLEVKTLIAETLQEGLEGVPVKTDIRLLFSSAKSQVIVTYTAERVIEAGNLPFLSQQVRTDYLIIIDTRDLKSDDEALGLQAEIIDLLNNLATDGDDASRLKFTEARFSEFSEGSGVWTHNILFSCNRVIHTNSHNV